MLFQNDINAVVIWSKTWDLKFKLDNCCVLHFGRVQTKYTIGETPVVSQEKDLVVLFSKKFDFREHMDEITKIVNQKLGVIARVFKNTNSSNIIH